MVLIKEHPHRSDFRQGFLEKQAPSSTYVICNFLNGLESLEPRNHIAVLKILNRSFFNLKVKWRHNVYTVD